MQLRERVLPAKQTWVRLLSVWLLTWALSACAGHAPPSHSAHAAKSSGRHAHAEKATPGLFLYEVRTREGAASYLLGTIHLGFGFDEVLTESARRAFENSPRVWMEADVTATDPRKLLQAAMLPPERSLRAIVGDEVWQKLASALGAQVPPMVMDRLKPWMPAMMLGLARIEEQLAQVRPDAPQRRMDLELMEQAQNAQKELFYLETVEAQIAVFDAVPVEEQVRELTHTLGNEADELGLSMLKAFARGDEAALSEAVFNEAQLAAAPGFFEAVLFQRNARWLPVLEREVERGGAFIAVGAAHLYGERGILAALEKRGFKPTRVQ